MPNDNAGSTQGAVQSLKLLVAVPMHGKGGDEIEDQADGIKRGASYAIAHKVPYGVSRSALHICPKIGFRVPYGGGGASCQRKKSEAAQPDYFGRDGGETVGGHVT